MKTQFKKILNLTNSLKTKASLSGITITSCLSIALFSLMTSKAAATVLPTLFEVPMNNIKERATTKEILIFTIFTFIICLLPSPREIKDKIHNYKERKLKNKEAFQSNQSPEPEKTTKEQNSKETDENENF